ncbi:threonine-phosphate decarboxylase CobD [Aurantimonas sp. MSK8Z-1]|uniref:threonine-phosphate decarboxylase CobD n=1 Tax=Mangrovibrevibacter kandeliae TaxID=2968473 RepID=UPI00222EDB23|nr:threonine-phosphate decarboxylase CobD [Aurantimonas sp. MSK8Z-1]MCW4117143.1 threonine-phosphate decarboxylase CobD [Aurantimonas sp. MSK8Z-1]
MSAAREHGGALDWAVATFGGSRGDWLDLSTGINPTPPPLPALPHEAWTRLPERAGEEALIQAARAFYGCPPAAGIAAAPGSQALISLLPHLFAPTGVAVVGPTYGGHASAWRLAGHRVVEINTPAAADSLASILVVTNPNNPDGRSFERDELLAIARRLAERDGLLVVDEAFADADPGESLAEEAGRSGLLVLRSFGKVFGLAGLRLGFALTTPSLAQALETRLGRWAISGPAVAMGTALMSDGAGFAALRETILNQSHRLFETLADDDWTIAGRTPLFALVRHDAAATIFDALCRRQILTRPFDHRPDWLRIGNPASAAEAERLRDALRAARYEIEAELGA